MPWLRLFISGRVVIILIVVRAAHVGIAPVHVLICAGVAGTAHEESHGIVDIVG